MTDALNSVSALGATGNIVYFVTMVVTQRLPAYHEWDCTRWYFLKRSLWQHDNLSAPALHDGEHVWRVVHNGEYVWRVVHNCEYAWRVVHNDEYVWRVIHNGEYVWRVVHNGEYVWRVVHNGEYVWRAVYKAKKMAYFLFIL